MILNKDRLLTMTQTFLSKRLHSDHSIVCVYLTGSMLRDDPFINGTADVDLVIVHNQPVDEIREIIGMTPEVTLDIHHIEQSYYSPPRKVRKDPWIGSSLCFDPLLLYNKGHWFEFMQASVEAGFFSPEYVIYRSGLFLNEARLLFTELENQRNLGSSIYISSYLKIIEDGCNAVACLSGLPLTDRTLMKRFNEVAEAINREDLSTILYGLILGQNSPFPYYDYFFNSWKYYLEYFGNSDLAPLKMKADRIPYYTAPVSYYWNEHLASALWIMAKTWCSVAKAYQLDDNEYFVTFCNMLEISPMFFAKRKSQLELFLDSIEDAQKNWGDSQGFDANDLENL